MNELYIVKHFLIKETYLKYRSLIKEEEVQGDTLILLKVLDQWYENNTVEPSLDDIAYIAATKLDRERIHLLFRNLEQLELKESVLHYLNDLKRKRTLEELSLATYEASTGKNVDNKIQKLFLDLSSMVESKEDDDPFVHDDLDAILDEQLREPGFRWRLKTLNRMLGSLRGGDFGFFVARPETGKTTMLASEISFMAEQLFKDDGPILWFNNEEQSKKVKLRTYQASIGVSLQQLLSNPKRYQEEYTEKTHDKILIYNNASTSKRDIENICKRYKPSMVVFDQIDKVQGFSSDREDLRLGAIYQWARELAKEYNMPVMGVCQADGTAEDVQWLTMKHVSNSKTSKQAEADWIVGIGKLEDPAYSKVRYLSVMKNKLTGDADTEPMLRHGKMEVLIDPVIARYQDIA